jgi:hypothetical protein
VLRVAKGCRVCCLSKEAEEKVFAIIFQDLEAPH